MKVPRSSMSGRDLVIPIVLIVAFVNPYVEYLQSISPVVFMLDHYALFAAGALIGYKVLKGSFPLFVLGAIPAVVWHYPLLFDMAASSLGIRLVCELTLFLGGLLVGSYIPKMSLSAKIISLALYMFADTMLSIFFILSYPQWSNAYYPTVAWSPSALPTVGIAMFVVMNVILVYAITTILRRSNFF